MTAGIPLGRAEHDRRMSLYRLGWSDVKIANHRGVHCTVIYRWRVKHGLPPKHSVLPSQKGAVLLAPEEEERRLKLYRRGLNDTAMARELGMTVKQMWRWRTRRQLPINKPVRDWERGPASFVSLDADLGEGGFNHYSFVADDAASQWLEEQGATVF